MKLDMKYLRLIVILYISMVEAIQGLHVSSKIAVEPSKRSFALTSYDKRDAIEFNESNWLRELPSSVSEPLKFVRPIYNVLQPQNLNKLENSRMNKPKESTDEKAHNRQFESGLSNFSTNTFEDSQGNLITTVKFLIITKKKNMKAGENTVIDGIRGIPPERIDPLNFPNCLNCSGSIPQVHKPRPNGHYVPSFIPELGIDKFNGGNPWRTGRVLVSDKLPPEFSKTRGK